MLLARRRTFWGKCLFHVEPDDFLIITIEINPPASFRGMALPPFPESKTELAITGRLFSRVFLTSSSGLSQEIHFFQNGFCLLLLCGFPPRFWKFENRPFVVNCVELLSRQTYDGAVDLLMYSYSCRITNHPSARSPPSRRSDLQRPLNLATCVKEFSQGYLACPGLRPICPAIPIPCPWLGPACALICLLRQ